MLDVLYKQMVRIRVVEEGIASHYQDQEMRCPVHLSIGQETVAVGVCSHLKLEDWVFSTHRSHAHYLAKGGDLKKMLAELHGKETGCCHGRGGSMHLCDKDVNFYAVPIVASAIPIAVGVAKAIKNKKGNEVVVCFFGDAAVESGQFHEAMNLAALWKLPILFVLEDNGLSVSTPKQDRQSVAGNERYFMALGCNVNVPRTYDVGDGMNVNMVKEWAAQALDSARNRHPCMIQFKVERYAEHCGPNESQDPCDRTKDWDTTRNMGIQERSIYGIDAKREFQQALSYAKSSPFPDPSTMLEGVYA